MKRPAKTLFMLLAACMLLGLCGCGGDSSVRELESIGTKRYGVVFRQGDRVAQAVSGAMDELSESGKLSELSLRWLGADMISYTPAAFDSADTASPTLSPEQTGESGEEPEGPATPSEGIVSRTLIVGVEAEYYPLAYSENGGVKGMCADIAQELGKLLGWEIKLYPIKSSELASQLNSGNIDCAVGVGIEYIDSASFTLGPVFMKSEIVVVSKNGGDYRTTRSLEGAVVGTAGDMSVLSALGNTDKITKYTDSFLAYESPEVCLEALSRGEIAAAAMDRLILDCNLIPHN